MALLDQLNTRLAGLQTLVPDQQNTTNTTYTRTGTNPDGSSYAYGISPWVPPTNTPQIKLPNEPTQNPPTTTAPTNQTYKTGDVVTAPGGVQFVYNQATMDLANKYGFTYDAFNKIVSSDPKMPSTGKEWLLGMADRAALGDKGTYSAIVAAIPKMQLTPENRAALYKMFGITAPAQTGSGGGGTGGGGTGGGGTGTPPSGNIPPPLGTLPPEGLIGAYPGNVAQPSLDWAQAILGGDFSNIPMYNELTDPKYSDPTQNPYIQAMVGSLKGELQEDWLGNMAALGEQAEAGGRYGSGLYNSLRTRATEETQEALSQAIAQMYSGAYENERQRRAGLASQFLGAQVSAAGVPLQAGQLGVAQGQLGVSMGQLGINQGYLGVAKGQLGLARDQFAFQKKMGLLGAQQDAINSWMQTVLGIAGLGGTQSGTGSNPYIPSSNPWVNGLLGAGAGALQGWQLQQYWNQQNNTGAGQTPAAPTSTGQSGMFTGYNQPNWTLPSVG